MQAPYFPGQAFGTTVRWALRCEVHRKATDSNMCLGHNMVSKTLSWPCSEVMGVITLQLGLLAAARPATCRSLKDDRQARWRQSLLGYIWWAPCGSGMTSWSHFLGEGFRRILRRDWGAAEE
jgi:hypothetical protein